MDALPQLWAIEKSALAGIEATVRSGNITKALLHCAVLEKQAAVARTAVKTKSQGRLALIPIYGAISQRGYWWSATSTIQVGAELRDALNDPQVESIIFDVDSPGGTIAGVMELSDAIFKSRERKPSYAIANSLAASALYWITSAATRFYAAPSAEVGSIGVFSLHVDFSESNKKLGVAPTYITAPKFKVEGNPDEPLSTEARATIQASVDDAYSDFVRQVARNRSVSTSTVESNFGQGRVVGARDALAAGMIDGIRTLEHVAAIARHGAKLRGTLARAAGQHNTHRARSDVEHRRAKWALMKRRAVK